MNIGTIGSGPIVDTFLEALQGVTGAQCVAVYSRSPQKAREFADKHHIAASYADSDALLADAQVDTIYIASPNSLHYAQAKKALQAGKHVICEKPFTSTVAELNELIALAKQHRRFLFEAITTVHMPNFHLMKENLHRVGDIKFVQCNYSQFSKKYNALLSGELPNVFNPQFSGGALMDINIYNVHFAIGLFGMPLSVDYIANVHENGIDTSGMMVMKYDGFICTCVGCKDSRSMNFAMVQGTEGYLNMVNGANGCEEIILETRTQKCTLNSQVLSQKLSYELDTFQKIIDDNDYPACERLLAHSLLVLNVIADARRRAGICFAADTER